MLWYEMCIPYSLNILWGNIFKISQEVFFQTPAHFLTTVNCSSRVFEHCIKVYFLLYFKKNFGVQLLPPVV